VIHAAFVDGDGRAPGAHSRTYYTEDPYRAGGIPTVLGGLYLAG
jgi:hypothetical protein